ncbi:glutathione S-transferase family protein [Marivita hallyeonensis]|uniref:Glutathione S-transferase n=1 Tax=Marivita hallyeonensis TaxID=996342 RepID=A0A1M5W6W4_9RHOB|nr:glutathione S-transferase family protein [Marivita hallyeonensis]SHH83262.1 glutathione S-transferase [Marivita hallyeonensis]
MSGYILHYAPDNASLIVRLALEELGVPYRTALVDRRSKAQRSAAYLALNPAGRIPVLETPDGPIFETAAILLWLADRHRNAADLAPETSDPLRGRLLSWLFYLSNTLHADMRLLFYPPDLPGDTFPKNLHERLADHFALLNAECAAGIVMGRANPMICDLYLAALLRWPALYPTDGDRDWFDLSCWPALHALAQRIEALPSAIAVAQAEGLGPTPFSNPQLPNPPEGSAL